MPIILGSLKETNKEVFRNSEQAFKEAIENGVLTENRSNDCFGCSNCSFCKGDYAGNWMYMKTIGNTDYFKNIYTRKYITTGN